MSAVENSKGRLPITDIPETEIEATIRFSNPYLLNNHHDKVPALIKGDVKSQDLRAITDLATEEEWNGVYEHNLQKFCDNSEN